MDESRKERYGRQIMLPEIGLAGQERLGAAKVLVVGAGGLGSPAALYLAAAGVGTIGLADGDAVDLSNLQRQVLHGNADIGRAKADSGRGRLLALNPDITVEGLRLRLDRDNCAGLVAPWDFVLDCTDNLESKFLINDACARAGKAYSHASVMRADGQIFTHAPGTACLRCLFPAPPPAGRVPTAATAGVLGPVAGLLGCLQAVEAIKFLTGAGTLLTGRLLTVEAWSMAFRTMEFARDPACPACSFTPASHSGAIL